MDGGVTPSQEEGCSSVRKTLGQIFEECCPVYMSYGMTYDEFWDGPNELPKYYRKKHKVELERKNFELWLQGKYVYEAVLACAPTLNAFSKSKEPLPYRERPLPLTKAEAEAELEYEREKQMQKNIDALRDMTKDFNQQFRKGDSKDAN